MMGDDWIMGKEKRKKVIISLDLSTEEWKEIPLPPEADDYYNHRLGFIEECLCIYLHYSDTLSSKKWVMKNNKWEVYSNESSKFEVAHLLKPRPMVDSQKRTNYVYTHDDGRLVPSLGDCIRASMFVKSLVYPHPYKVWFVLF